QKHIDVSREGMADVRESHGHMINSRAGEAGNGNVGRKRIGWTHRADGRNRDSAGIRKDRWGESVFQRLDQKPHRRPLDTFRFAGATERLKKTRQLVTETHDRPPLKELRTPP